jgi:hypothetical protein
VLFQLNRYSGVVARQQASLLLQVAISIAIGYVLGKAWVSTSLLTTTEPNLTSPKRFAITGAYVRNFEERQALGNGLFEVIHRLEHKAYLVKRLRLEEVQFSSLFKVIDTAQNPSTYVTSWIEESKTGYELFVQYCLEKAVLSH